MANAPVTKFWNRNFTLLWLGLVQSYLGDAFLAIGVMALVLEMTNSPVAAGTLVALEGLPKLFGPLAGAIVDRTSKRRLMILGDVVRGVLLIALWGLYEIDQLAVWHLYIMVIVLGAAGIFYDPSLRVMLPQITPDKELPRANSLIQGSAQISMIVGASVAGGILALFGPALALLIDGVSFFIATAVIMLVRFPPTMLQTSPFRPGPILRDMVGGIRFIATTSDVLMLTGLAFFINLVLSPVNVIFPIFSNTVLGEGVAGYGYLAASVAGGLLLGTIVVGWIGDRLPYTMSIILGLFGMMLMLTGLSFSQSLIPAIMLTVGLGMMPPFIQVPLVSRLQRAVPRQFQGRVFATLSTLVTLALPLSAALAGQALAKLPVPLIFRIGATGTFLIALLWSGMAVRQHFQTPIVSKNME